MTIEDSWGSDSNKKISSKIVEIILCVFTYDNESYTS